MQSITASWESVFRRDLSVFKDPGTEIISQAGPDRVLVEWRQRHLTRCAELVVPANGAEVFVVESGAKLGYKQFFSSGGMADLLGLAQSIDAALSCKIELGSYVDTKAAFEPESKNGPSIAESAVGLIGKAVVVKDKGTAVVMVTGDAGAGKTQAFQYMVARAARDFLEGRRDSIFLYVDAQGRALARFNEALATELQDLRSTTTYHAISMLTRLGLIIPVIDGLDELLGVGSYDDAFVSFSKFIDELEGNGAIVASARGTYYEQEFRVRADKSTKRGLWGYAAIHMKLWGLEEISRYCEIKCGQGAPGVIEKFKRLPSKQFELSKKPFFAAKMLELFTEGVSFEENDHVLKKLVDRYIERELPKLATVGGSPQPSDVRALLGEICEEMWNLGVRELDVGTIKEIAELFVEERKFDRHMARSLVDKAPKLAMLTNAQGGSHCRFEHEVFFSFVLADRVIASMEGILGAATGFLGRGAIPPETEDVIESIYLDRVKAAKDNAILLLNQAAAIKTTRSEQVAENAGRLLALIFRRSERISDRVFSNIVFSNTSLDYSTVNNCDFVNVVFQGVTLHNANWRQCRFNRCRLTEISFSDDTVFSGEGIDLGSDVCGIRFVGSVFEYSPEKIRSALRRVSWPVAPEQVSTSLPSVDPALVKLSDRFSHAMLKRNVYCEEDDTLSFLDESKWDKIQRALIKSGLVTEEDNRPTGGSHKRFYRRHFDPRDLLGGVRVNSTERIMLYWQLLAERS